MNSNLPAELSAQITGFIKSKNAALFATLDQLATGAAGVTIRWLARFHTSEAN